MRNTFAPAVPLRARLLPTEIDLHFHSPMPNRPIAVVAIVQFALTNRY